MLFKKRKPKLPTALEILECIYNNYYDDFASFTEGKRLSKIYVPINFDLIGEKLGVDGDIPFGVINYYLNPKHQFRGADNDVELFVLRIGPQGKHDVNCIQFPFLAACLG